MNRKERRRLAKQQKSPALAPDNAAGLLAEGMAFVQAGKNADAISRYVAALKLEETNPNTHYVLGVLYRRENMTDQSITHYHRAVVLAPGFADAFYNLGNVLADTAQQEAAIVAYQGAVKANPKMSNAWNNLGNALKTTGRVNEAKVAYEQALMARADYPDAMFNLGEMARAEGKLEVAVQLFEDVLVLAPDHISTLNNLGSTFRDLKRHDDAFIHLRKAIQLAPQSEQAFVNLANTLSDLGQYAEAAQHYQQALALQPTNPNALTNFGNLLYETGQFDAAADSFRSAVSHAPDFAEAHYNLGLFELRLGNYAAGWAHFAWRWQMPAFQNWVARFGIPEWSGQALDDKKLLVWDEQGVGDTVLFASLLSDLQAMGGQVHLQCDPRLIPLLSRSHPELICTPKPSGTPPRVDQTRYDYHSSIGDLAKHLRPDAAAFGQAKAYLKADPAQVETMRGRYNGSSEPLLIGIAWHSIGPDTGSKKSIQLKELQAILETSGCRFIDLQYGDTRAEREAFRDASGIDIYHDDDVDQMYDLDGFAAQISALDLVITISNTTAHMAGSLGVPTWLIAGNVPIWYWMRERSDSPWYPSLQIYRQPTRGDWGDVIRAVASDLEARSMPSVDL